MRCGRYSRTKGGGSSSPEPCLEPVVVPKVPRVPRVPRASFYSGSKGSEFCRCGVLGRWETSCGSEWLSRSRQWLQPSAAAILPRSGHGDAEECHWCFNSLWNPAMAISLRRWSRWYDAGPLRRDCHCQWSRPRGHSVHAYLPRREMDRSSDPRRVHRRDVGSELGRQGNP